MTELEIHLLGVDQVMMRPLVVLREKTGEHRLLPIWLDAPEALAIAQPMEDGPESESESPRPLTYELLARIVSALGHAVERIRICAQRDGDFFAELWFDSGACVPCRASEAVAIALNLGLEIGAADDVLAYAGIPESALLVGDPHDGSPAGGPAAREAELERFREFLDTVDPEDFSMSDDRPGAGPEARSPASPDPERIRRRVVVEGAVQGVFFRDSCRDVARRHEVAGWVTNRGDGAVEAVFEGAPDAVDRLVEWAGVGPARAQVRAVEVVKEQPEGLIGFSVR